MVVDAFLEILHDGIGFGFALSRHKSLFKIRYGFSWFYDSGVVVIGKGCLAEAKRLSLNQRVRR
jgi:hypothetical protein